MVHSASAPAIVAGVDGSESALHAVRWAADEAARWCLPLVVVHSQIVASAATYPGAVAMAGGLYETMGEHGQECLRQARDAALAVSADLDVHAEMHESPTIPTLLEQSKTARMIVLGSRGSAGFTGLMVRSAGRSTAVALAARGNCPVTVVRAAKLCAQDYGGPVVVSVDGSSASHAAVDYAFDQAAARGTDLLAVHAWTAATAVKALNGPAANNVWKAVETNEQNKYPDVPVLRVVVRDRPLRGLLAHSENAQLIVAGCRARGGVRPTRQALLRHAPCPVTMVGAPRAS